MGGPAARFLLAGLAVIASPARALLVSPARLPAIRHASGAACGLRMAADPEEPGGVSTEEKQRGSRKKGILWNRVRNRVRQDDLKRAPIGESVEVITKEIDQVLADRRKRLDVKLKTSLKRFRTEVVSEVALQANETKDRQARLRERRGLILTSLSGLREDILDEIEATVSSQRALGKALEQSLRGLRADWEREVNDLIDGAKTDVDLAVNDIEEAIKEQREEWRRNVEVLDEQSITNPHPSPSPSLTLALYLALNLTLTLTPTPTPTKVFEEQWITAPTRKLGPRFRRNATGPDGTPEPEPELEPSPEP